jgi:hypothetical protein
MVRVTLGLQLLLLVLIQRQSDVYSDQCSELQREIDLLEKDLAGIELEKHNKEQDSGNCRVSVYFTVRLSSPR